jgi:hypothetical protein
MIPAVRSVVDLGGGDGGWLRVFKEHGVEEVLLIEHPSVAPHLVIDQASFNPCDISRDLPPPGKFDVAVCLECAEHLPKSRAEDIVDWLTSSAEYVVFSAAIPGQGGNGHVHLRFPLYWADLFLRRGYERFDILRPRIIAEQRIAWWYRQNMFIFAAKGTKLRTTANPFVPDEFHLVHKNVFEAPRSFRVATGDVWAALVRALRRRLFGGITAENRGNEGIGRDAGSYSNWM